MSVQLDQTEKETSTWNNVAFISKLAIVSVIFHTFSRKHHYPSLSLKIAAINFVIMPLHVMISVSTR